MESGLLWLCCSTLLCCKQKLPELEKRLISLNSGNKEAVKLTIEEFSVEIQLDEASVLNK